MYSFSQKNYGFLKKLQKFLKMFGISEKLPTFVIPNNNGAVAQMVEQRTENPCVGSSILPSTTEKCLSDT